MVSVTGGFGVGVTTGGTMISRKNRKNKYTIRESWFGCTSTKIHSEFTNMTTPWWIETIFTNVEVNLWDKEVINLLKEDCFFTIFELNITFCLLGVTIVCIENEVPVSLLLFLWYNFGEVWFTLSIESLVWICGECINSILGWWDPCSKCSISQTFSILVCFFFIDVKTES